MVDTVAVISVANGLLPPMITDNENQGPKGARCRLTLGAGTVTQISLIDEMERMQINNIQSMFVDNSGGTNFLSISTSVMAVPILVPPGVQGVFPLYIGGDGIVFVTRADAGDVTLVLCNFSQPFYMWDKDGATVVTISGTVTVDPAKSATATPANVAMTGASVALFAANANRKAATIWNDGAAVMYVNFGAAASATACVVAIAANQYYELPQPIYTGAVNVLAAFGTARVMEQS